MAIDVGSRPFSMIGVGIIGYGYWGPNLVRNFSEAAATRVVAVCDTRAESLAPVTKRYPAIRTTRDFTDLLNDPSIDAIAVATPVRSHFELALGALAAGKHVLVEKPMTETVEQAHRLIDAAERHNRVLMVDHTFVYTPAIQKIRHLVAAEELGEIYYYDSIRVNLGLFQRDVNVIWDLAVHDFSILEYVLGAHPVAVSANGASPVSQSPESIAYISLFFASGAIAHINVNWLAPVKVRQILIGGSRKMILYNDLEPSEKVKVYDKGVTLTDDPDKIYQLRVGYRAGDMWAPRLANLEGLAVEVKHFVDCINNNLVPETDGRVGMRVVELLEATSQSLRRRGQPIELRG
jgi:predicted dehydrogenase